MQWLAILALLALAGACTALPELTTPEAQVPSPPASYVALGDSLATGAGAERGYAERYAKLLDGQTDTSLRFANLGRNGWTSADLLVALRDDPRFADAVSDADVVTINIGGNDLLGAQRHVLMGECGGDACLHDVVATFAENWDAIVAEIDGLVSADTELVTMDIYNPFVAGLRALGLLDRTKPFLDAVNHHVRASSADHGMTVAPVHEAFNGEDGMGDPVPEGLIAPDRLHPSDAGHATIAELLAEAGPG